MADPGRSPDSGVKSGPKINPYQPPESSTPRQQLARPPTTLGTTWSGRRSLLQSVFLMRFSAVVSALMWGRSLLTWLNRPLEVYSEFGTEGLRNIILSPVVLIPGLLAVATAGVFLYLNLLLWRYAQEVKELAAGRNRSDVAAGQAHLRFWRMDVIALLLVVAGDIVNYVIQWQANQPAGQ